MGSLQTIGKQASADHQRQEDALCLELVSELRRLYDQQKLITGDFSNVFGIFFHEIMIYLSSFYLLRKADERQKGPMKFPFLNSAYVESPQAQGFEPPHALDWKENLVRASSRFLPGRKLSIVRKSSGLNLKELFVRSLGRFRLDFPKERRAYLKNSSQQLSELKVSMSRLAKLVGAPSSGPFVDNFLSYVENWTTTQELTLRSEWLLSGSTGSFLNRLQCANQKEAGGKVLSILHGEQCSLTIDEPAMGYGEFSYTDACLSYGSYGLEPEQFNHSLGEMPHFIRRSSPKLASYYKGKFVRSRPISETTRVLYVPTAFSGIFRYGPFRDMEDAHYLRWQEALGSSPISLFYKAHPKSRAERMPSSIGVDRIDKRPLEECLKDYDAFVLDYFSTALSTCIATEKPILYFDIGLRNIHPLAWRDLEQRAFVRRISHDADYAEQIRSAVDEFNRQNRDYINNFTEHFSIEPMKVTDDIGLVFQYIEGKIN